MVFTDCLKSQIRRLKMIMALERVLRLLFFLLVLDSRLYLGPKIVCFGLIVDTLNLLKIKFLDDSLTF